MFETIWGLPVVGYLFLAGMGAGALTVSASVLLRGGSGGFNRMHFQIARYGAFLAPLPLIVGTSLLIFELGTFHAAIQNGEYWKLFRWINLFQTINLSPMSIGSWALALCIIVSVVYAHTFRSPDAGPDDRLSRLRQGIAWIAVPLGIAVAVYTGVLLGAMPSRPFWNSPILPLLFLMSALSTGVAGILLLKALFDGKRTASKHATDPSGYLLSASDVMFIGFEILAIFLFYMFAHLTIGAPAEAISAILTGSLAMIFWIGVFLIGLVLPGLVELRYVVPQLIYKRPYAIPRRMEIVVCAVILFGAFLLRYVVVIAGQITGPVGI
jgi:formate-dependent nitrite reductase membrane component NrfD